ncbi:uncharacterized protein G2W53_036549 [Senna tora]|uniref:Uncharacterized protein n=1 Tax=Senna tora TaxID=362788 RepID=A0A834SVD6_9FABA|nr:uncharacterized protein G2W53_036549 [Senna tora]
MSRHSTHHPRDTVHHSITLCTAREHCAPLHMTLYRLQPVHHEHITTATLTLSAPLYKSQTGKSYTGLYYSLCKGLTKLYWEKWTRVRHLSSELK